MASGRKSFLLDQFGRPAQANSQFYPGIQHGRERRWVPFIVGDSDETSHTSYNRLQALNHSRQMYANCGFFRGPVRDIATYAVGPGMLPQSQVEEDSVATLYEDYFTYWGENYADLAGKFTFNEFQYLASIGIDVDGDLGFHMYAESERAIGQLQLVEGHRIESPEDGARGATRPTWRDGVRLDRFGRRVAFSVAEMDLDGKKSHRTLDAGSFIFLSDPDRSDATRGMPSLTHGIGTSRDIADILGFEKVGVKMGSAIGLAIKTHSGGADPGNSFIEQGYSAAETGGLPWDSFMAGMIPRLKVGEEIASFGSNRPSPAFMGFLAFLIRDIAVGLGLPFEFVWDLALARGAGSRFILQKAQRRFDQRQALLVNRLLTRVWRWVIARGIVRKEIPAAAFWWMVKWQGPAKITVDLGREAQANRDDLKYGNRTLLEDSAERGLHWKDHVRAQRSVEARDLMLRAMALKKEFPELTLDKALFLLSADSPNAPTLEKEKSNAEGRGEAPRDAEEE